MVRIIVMGQWMWKHEQTQIFSQRIDDRGEFLPSVHLEKRIIHQVSDLLAAVQHIPDHIGPYDHVDKRRQESRYQRDDVIPGSGFGKEV